MVNVEDERMKSRQWTRPNSSVSGIVHSFYLFHRPENEINDRLRILQAMWMMPYPCFMDDLDGTTCLPDLLLKGSGIFIYRHYFIGSPYNMQHRKTSLCDLASQIDWISLEVHSLF